MLQDKVLKTIKKFDLFSLGDRVLIGVSGGTDSLALLYLLNELSLKLGIKIIVGHLNHGIRGSSAAKDEEFVINHAGCLGLDCYSEKVKWPKSLSKQFNEDKLRKLRYDFLCKVALKHKIDKIAIAHTLDDQAETVLMRLIRGTGLYGLISIMPKRKFGSKFILRPLIEVSKKELAEYLERLKIKPRIDRSNFSRKFLRNRIRHELMEYLRKINPNIKETLARFAQQAAIDYDYLYKHSKKILKDQKGPVIKIGLGSFTKLHTALQRMAIRLALESVSGELRTFTNKHWEEIQDLVESRPTGSIVNLTQKVIVKKDNKYIVVSAQKKEKSIY